MAFSFVQRMMVCITLLFCFSLGLLAFSQVSLAEHKNAYEKNDPRQEKNAVLTLLSSELLSRTIDDGMSLLVTVRGDTAAYECTGSGDQSIAACQQTCLAIQVELENTHAPEGGCSSINNGCQCTHDPFE